MSSCHVNCLLRDLWWPCFNQRYRWLFALHLSSYCLVTPQLPQSQHPCVTSRNHDMNLTFPIPPRGSALPQSSPWHPVSQEWGKCCFWGLNGGLSLSNSLPSPAVTPACTNVSRKSLVQWGLHEEGTRQETPRARAKNNVLQTWGITTFPETLGICSSFSASDPEAESDLEVQPSPLQNGFWCTPKSHRPYSHLVFHHFWFPEWFSLITTWEKSQWSNPTSLVPSVPANNTQGHGCNSTNTVYRKNCKTTITSHTTDLPSFM